MTEQERLNNMVDKELLGRNKQDSEDKSLFVRKTRVEEMYAFLHQIEEKIDILRVVSVNKDKKLEIYKGMLNQMIALYDDNMMDDEIVNGIKQDLANIDEG